MSLTTQTDAAKELISTVARAFYDDEKVVVLDFLLRCKFLRDGPGMGKQLGFSTKQMKRALEFLKKEHLAKTEMVQGFVVTYSSDRMYRRKKTADFWYCDFGVAVKAILLRLHLIRTKLEAEIKDSVTSSNYVCPGYKTRACNGYYTEMEVQHCPCDAQRGQFLCQECFQWHKNNPTPPPISSYTLTLIDNSQRTLDAETKLRRFKTQMAAKVDGNGKQLRKGVFELLQKVKSETEKCGGNPVTDNLPSDNGAANHVAPSSDHALDCGNPQPSLFADEAQREFRGLRRFRAFVGRDVVLDIATPIAGMTALNWAHRGVVGSATATARTMSTAPVVAGQSNGCSRSNTAEASSTPQTVAEVAPSSREDHDEPPLIPERPPKMTCRQTTPYFLRDNIGRKEEEEEQRRISNKMNADEVARRMRGLGIDELLSSEDRHAVWVMEDVRDSDAAKLEQAQYQKKINGGQNVSAADSSSSMLHGTNDNVFLPRRANSFPPVSLFRSTDTCSSVAWESCDEINALLDEIE